MKTLSRILLGFSALLFLFGAWVHTSAFAKVSGAIAKSDLPEFFGKGFKTLWLQDSGLQIVLAILFGLAAIRPSAVTRLAIVLVGLIPLTTAMLAYYFIGNFIAGHLFLTASVAAILGGLFLRS